MSESLARDTVDAALRWANSLIQASGSETARLDTEVLLGYVLGLERTRPLAHGERRLSPADSARFAALVARRAAHEPVAYLVGRRAFYDVDLLVDARVLIPRPETEHLVERALGWARAQGAHACGARALRVVDVGTGSGAIALVLARHIAGAQVWAVDRSTDALDVARANLQRYDLLQRVTLVCGDLLTPLDGPFDLIAANLPYVTIDALPTLAPDVRDYEPHVALDGGRDGLDLVARLLAQAPQRLVRPGLLLLEIDPRQAVRVVALANNAFPDANVTTLKDYAGWERVVCVEQW
jgi:release factor glutamine methyltransferase